MVGKIPWWNDPNQNIQIIENTEKAMKKFGYFYGAEVVHLTKEHIDALLNGKAIAFTDGEYSTFLVYKKE